MGGYPSIGQSAGFNFLIEVVMAVVLYILVLVGTFVVMEGITWLTHKYVMHGFLWYLH